MNVTAAGPVEDEPTIAATNHLGATNLVGMLGQAPVVV